MKVTGSGVPSNLRVLDAMVGDGVKLQAPLTAVLRDVSSADLAMATLAGASLTGAIALIERGGCDFSIKINNAQRAGAAGVVLYQDESHLNDIPFSRLGAVDTGIPAMMIYRSAGWP